MYDRCPFFSNIWFPPFAKQVRLTLKRHFTRVLPKTRNLTEPLREHFLSSTLLLSKNGRRKIEKQQATNNQK